VSIESRRGVDEANDEPPSERPFGYTPRRLLIVLLVLGVGALYFSGRLDHLLYNVGLNYNQCARNGLGAVFCGSELAEYRTRVEGAAREGKEASEKVEREGKEAEAKAQTEERHSQETIERSEREAQSSPALSEEEGSG
jgi:hypothetical protein